FLAARCFYGYVSTTSHLRYSFPSALGISRARPSYSFPFLGLSGSLESSTLKSGRRPWDYCSITPFRAWRSIRRAVSRHILPGETVYSKLSCLLSTSSSIFLVERPPPKPVRLPSLPITRWHG